jgi:hypothetical protein
VEDVLKTLLMNLFTAGILSACAPLAPPVAINQPVISACDVDNLAHLVGLPRRALDGTSFEGPVRWLAPGSMMTMDFSPDRVNFELDADDIITRIYCG